MPVRKPSWQPPSVNRRTGVQPNPLLMSSETLPPSTPGLSPSARSSLGNWLGWLNQQETVLVLAFIIVFAGVTLLNPRFAQPGNLVDILYNSSHVAVAAVGITMVIFCGHIDISVRSVLVICATV